jgi:hypothetical protein
MLAEKVFGNYFPLREKIKKKNKKIFFCKKIFFENLFVKKFFLAYKSRRAFEVSVAYCPEAHTLREGRGDARLASSNPKRNSFITIYFLFYF